MPEFNFLHDTQFPHLQNVDTYKYANELDYGRFDYTQMRLQLCTVPWDMGEAHIGNRTISGIGNVVYFGTREARDAWFDAIPDSECYRFETKFKELHRNLEIDVPVPYDMCAKHNYLRVQYSKLANDDSLLEYEGEDGLREWFWFVREVEFIAPNTTRLHLLDDAFQTWIYDVNVSGMILERGHAPMMAMRADEFLQNPIENCEYLLTDDVNFGDTMRTQHIDALAFNSGEMFACVATTGDYRVSWGSKDNESWRVHAQAAYETNGVPSVDVIAMEPENLYTFLENINLEIPQFKQTIQAIFFAPKMLVDITGSFRFAHVNCYAVSSSRKTLDFLTLDKDLFGYPEQYADMAKLYTYPYAEIDITDENGNSSIVRVEDTNGKIEVSAMLALSFPFLKIDAHLLGIGGNERAVIQYRNITANDFTIGGNWFEFAYDWNIPTFAVVLDPAIEYDYSTYFDRKQARTDYYAAWDNAYDVADTLVANAGLQVAANNSKVTASNANMIAETELVNSYDGLKNQALNMITYSNANSTIAANEMQGSISAAAGLANGVIGAVGSAVSGNPIGAVSQGVSALVGSAATLASTSIANGLTETQADNTVSANNTSAGWAHSTNTAKTNYATRTQSSAVAADNSMTSGSAANSAATQKGNADRIADAAQSAIDNGVKQGAMRAPLQFGTFANGETAVTKPQGLFAQIRTQSKAAISAAGDEFARYGYAYNKQWHFNGDWNIGRYFTYWKLRDFWVSNLNVPDMYMDRLRFFLFGGVTIWRAPEYIGKINPYDNF